MFGNPNNRGIVYHALNELFGGSNSYQYSISMLEVYKESIYDLLGPSSKELKIKEDSMQGFYADRLSKIVRMIYANRERP